MTIRCLALTGALGLLACVFARAEPIPERVVTRFDSDLAGWTLTDGGGNTLQWLSAGGSPGGYAHFQDGGPVGGWLSAPAEFGGDWSALDGFGLLAWDHRVIDPGTLAVPGVPFEAWIAGPGGAARFSLALGWPSANWHSITAPIAEEQWDIESGTWDALLADVRQLHIRAEMLTNPSLPGDQDGIDSVRLLAAPPGPGDANWDGFVDDNDLSILLANWDAPNRTWGMGDLDNSTTVDDNDLSLLLANWTGTPPLASLLVPEPTSAWLLLAAGVLLHRRR